VFSLMWFLNRVLGWWSSMQVWCLLAIALTWFDCDGNLETAGLI
jgi:hypothetical protein